jgi:hypothetical protein
MHSSAWCAAMLFWLATILLNPAGRRAAAACLSTQLGADGLLLFA